VPSGGQLPVVLWRRPAWAAIFVFSQNVGGDGLDLAGAYAAYMIVRGAVSIVIGRLSDTHSRYRLMMGGYALNALPTFG
jgi:MFS family permease